MAVTSARQASTAVVPKHLIDAFITIQLRLNVRDYVANLVKKKKKRYRNQNKSTFPVVALIRFGYFACKRCHGKLKKTEASACLCGAADAPG